MSSKRLVLRVLCGYCTKRTQRSVQTKKTGNNNEQLPCNGNEIMAEAYNDGKKGDLNNKSSKDRRQYQPGRCANFRFSKNSFAEETTMKSKQRESSISLGIYLLAK